ncbi:hypothetical protein BC567DRAFT_218470, partial [Phyllosticta citribraziliensis]
MVSSEAGRIGGAGTWTRGRSQKEGAETVVSKGKRVSRGEMGAAASRGGVRRPRMECPPRTSVGSRA